MNRKSIIIVFLAVFAVTLAAVFHVERQVVKPQNVAVHGTIESQLEATQQVTRDKLNNLLLSTPAPTAGVGEFLADVETRAFKLAERSETRREARQLFFEMLQEEPRNLLAAQMLTELSVTKDEKDQTVDRLLSSFSECSSCNELGLIAADLLIALDRPSEAVLLAQKLAPSVTQESERRHLASLQIKIGNKEGARANLEKVKSSRRRLAARLGKSNAAEIIWKKIDDSKINSLTPKG